MATKDKKLGWHFLPKNMRLDYGDGRKAVVGQTLTVQDPNAYIRCCSVGMHASPEVGQAAGFHKGPVLTRVEVWGDLDEHTDKFAGRNRKVIWAKEITVQDANEIGKMLGNRELMDLKRGGQTLLYALDGATGAENFEAALRQWARKNGCPNIREKKLKDVAPPFTAKDVIGRLDTRYVTTKRELLRHLAAAGFSTKATDGYSVDLFEQLKDDGEFDEKVHIIEDFTRHGGVGLLRINRK